MYDSLKPTPVSVTTPITMPTVAAAAPTASAYLAPVSNAVDGSLLRDPRLRRDARDARADTRSRIARNTQTFVVAELAA